MTCISCLYIIVGTFHRGGKNVGIMFLVEAALGKEKHILHDDHTLREAPKGYDSIVAKVKEMMT